MKGLLFAFAFIAGGLGFLRGQSLVSAPIIGAFDRQSVKVWFMVTECGDIDLEVAGKRYTYPMEGWKCWHDRIPVTIEVRDLAPGRSYQAQIWSNGSAVGDPFTIQTASEEVKENWSFMLGSCTLYGIGASRLITPGTFTDIFNVMGRQPTDFMLWMGDNVYLLNGEWNSDRRMYEKYTKVRLQPEINAFMRTRPNLALLDDHDYGPDNAQGDFENKAATEGCFKDFWPNPSYPAEGAYSRWDYQDASFFLMDNRWFREGETKMLGDVQMNWLKENLRASTAAFKFIAIGSQTITEANPRETWSKFPERQELFDFIRQERITGVIFLSGDRHYTELCRLKLTGMYPLYDFTNSPLTSILRKQVDNPNDVEFSHPLRVEGTKFARHNYGVVTISGAPGARVCTLQTFDASGQKVWEHMILQEELDWD